MRAGTACTLFIVVLAAGCGGASHQALDAKGPSRLPALGSRCGTKVEANLGWFRASDGVLLDGAALGTGKTGVVLAHESPADLCGWVPYARVLSRAGFRVLLIDHRGVGYSQSPADYAKAGHFSHDLEGPVQLLPGVAVPAAQLVAGRRPWLEPGDRPGRGERRMQTGRQRSRLRISAWQKPPRRSSSNEFAQPASNLHTALWPEQERVCCFRAECT